MEASDRKELRVILDNINKLNDVWFDTFQTDEGQTSIHDALEYEITKADKILAKRPRNCDIGTAEEQAQRYDEFCAKTNCAKCPVQAMWGIYFGVVKNEKVSCGLIWAQMPYEADAKKEERNDAE